MALGAGMGGGGSRRRGRGRNRRQTLSEINVTPLVDVMLVLLIIFMISAPLLNVGVKVELPKTEAAALEQDKEPLTISVKRDGAIFIQETPVAYEELGAKLAAIADGSQDKPIFVRADGAAPYEAVARVMAKLSTSGFIKINLVTDTSSARTAAAPASAPQGTGAP